MKYWSGVKTAKPKAYEGNLNKKPGRKRKLSMFEEYVMVLMRFRLGIQASVLGDLFGVTEARVSQIFTTWINLMYQVLQHTIKWPSREHVLKYLPKSFAKYPRTRCIIDCTEIFIQKPQSPTAQSVTYSTYKSHHTYKVLVGISPTGAFTFVSEPWGG